VKTAELGWQPDPTGRYEYRYWDGSEWSADVFDDGLMFRDPFSLGTMPAPRRGTSRRWSPRLIGSGVLAAGLAASVAFAMAPVTGGGTQTAGGAQPDRSTTTAEQEESSSTTGQAESTTTSGPPLPGSTAAPPGGGPGGPGSSTTSSSAAQGGGGAGADELLDTITEGMMASGAGMLTEDQARCFAQGLVDALGPDRIRELGLDEGNLMTMSSAMTGLTPEEQMALGNSSMNCTPPSGAPPAGAGA
jgi:hypothetical protein